MMRQETPPPPWWLLGEPRLLWFGAKIQELTNEEERAEGFLLLFQWRRGSRGEGAGLVLVPNQDPPPMQQRRSQTRSYAVGRRFVYVSDLREG